MGSGDIQTLRALPRFFLPGPPAEVGQAIPLPPEEWKKVHGVLRMSTGDELAVLMNDGRLCRCTLEGRSARVVSVSTPATESPIHLTLALVMPRPEKLEESVRMATEMGVAAFKIFPCARSIVRWDSAKRESKMARLRVIAREACEVAYRTRLPTLDWEDGLASVLSAPGAIFVMSEGDSVEATLPHLLGPATIVIGPEGGWAPQEVALIGSRAVTLGPRVFRVDTAVAAACALALLR